jgi:ribonuclease HII
LKNSSQRSPDLKNVEEQACYAQGYRYIAGIDEVGRGCLAGPVVASAVIMPRGQRLPWYQRVRDSKLLTPQQRDELSPLIHDSAVSVGTGVVDAYLIDQIGMTAAVHLAMRQAVTRLRPQPDFLLIDYLSVPDLKFPQKGVADGDTLCFSIACASIVAKVYRDHLMADLDRRYPGYGLARHKGYGTADHVACLRKLGPSPIHRRLFQPVRNLAQLSFDDWVKKPMMLDADGT